MSQFLHDAAANDADAKAIAIPRVFSELKKGLTNDIRH